MYLTLGEISKALGISTEANCFFLENFRLALCRRSSEDREVLRKQAIWCGICRGVLILIKRTGAVHPCLSTMT